MVLSGRVIDIVLSEIEPNYPPDMSGNEVTAVLCDETVFVGMGYQEGRFSDYISPQPVEPTLSEGEQTQLETALNIEYLICLAELNG